jgi:hypothetical protein
MNASDYITKGMAIAASYSLDTQWRFAVAALATFCGVALLALLPDLPELHCISRLVRTFVPLLKVARMLAGRRRDWRGVLLDMLA